MNQENNNYNFDPMTGQPIQNQTQPVEQNQIQPNINPVQTNISYETMQFNNQNLENQSKKSFDKKKILLIGVGILILVLGIVLFFYLKDNLFGGKELDLKNIFDPNKPIVIKEDEKYGYITSDGEELIEPQFSYAGSFYGDYAVIKIDNPDDTDEYFTELYQIINKKGKTQLENGVYLEPSYIAEYDRWLIDGELYNNKLKKILDDDVSVSYIGNGYFSYNNFVINESGIIDYKGKEKFSWDGTVTSVEISENPIDGNIYAHVSNYEEREIIINVKTGKTVYTLEDPKDYYISSNSDGIFNIYNRNDYENEKYIYIQDNKVAYEADVEDLSIYDYENEILQLDYGYDYDTWSSNYKYYDLKNKEMLDEEPSKSDESDNELEIMESTYGFKTYYCDSSYGITAKEESIVPCKYDDIELLNYNLYSYMKQEYKQELVFLEKDNKISLYDLNSSKSIKTFNTHYIYDYENSSFIKIELYNEDSYSSNEFLIYNVISGESKKFNSDDNINVYSNYIVLQEDDKDTYYNTNLEKIYEIEK